MNIKKLTKAVSSVLLLSAAVLTGCQRENDGRLILVAESFSSNNSKLVVDGTHSIWANGDSVRINSGEYVVAVNGSNEASISGVPGANAFYAVYPSSLCGNLTSTSATLNLPATYQYRTNGSGKQILKLPMVGYLDPNESNGPLYLNHATGALLIRIRNYRSTSPGMYIDEIQIKSNNYKLNGTRTVDVSNPSSSAVASNDESEKVVTMLFTQQELLIPYEQTADVMIPVPPVGSDNKFTVKICAHTRLEKYVFEQEQSDAAAGALLRNQVGCAKIQLQLGGANTTVTDILSIDASGNYEIKNAADYAFLVEACNNDWKNVSNQYFKSKNYIIYEDIDMSGRVVEPIYSFSGHINGNYNTISNLTIESSTSNRVAMFATGAVGANVVERLTLSNVTVSYTGSEDANSYMAGLVAYDASNTSYSQCKVLGLTVNHSSPNYNDRYIYIGGLVGYVDARSSSTFDGCQATNIVWSLGETRVYSYVYIGGLVGYSAISTSIDGCSYASPTSSLSFYAAGVRWGGLVGELASGQTLSVSYTSSNVNVAYIKGASSFGAGLVGRSVGTVDLGDMVSVGGSINASANSPSQIHTHDIANVANGGTISGSSYTGSVSVTTF